MKSTLIRTITLNDYAQWQELWQGYNYFYGRRNLPYQITQLTFSRFFQPAEPIYALVAEAEGQLVGLAHYLFHLSSIQVEKTCYLQDLFISENFRGQGIASALIENVVEKAKMAKSPRLYWLTKADNIIARKLYDKIANLTDFVLYNKII